MPTYVYACTNPDCGNEFEAVQAFTDDALTQCPACGKRVRKVFGSVGVVFKGAGFYRNDSRAKADSGASTSADKAATGAGESSGSTNSSGSGDAVKATPAASSAGSSSKSSAAGGGTSSSSKPAASTA